jgi:hypothetical protein
VTTESISLPPIATIQEIIDSKELASRWKLPETWVRDGVRRRTKDPIPHIRFGKYVRFVWGSPELVEWFDRHRSSSICAGRRTP